MEKHMGTITVLLVALFIVTFIVRRRRKRRINKILRRYGQNGIPKGITITIGNE